VQHAPDGFEFALDGLAYGKGPDGELRTSEGVRVDVPDCLSLELLDSAAECPASASTSSAPAAAARSRRAAAARENRH
jgi:ferredoxin